MNSMTLKEFCFAESQRTNVTPGAIIMRLRRGSYGNSVARVAAGRKSVLIIQVSELPVKQLSESNHAVYMRQWRNGWEENL